MKYSEKNEFIKERSGGPTFKLWRVSRGPTFKFWRGSWGPTFKLWGGSRVPSPEVLGPGVLVPLLHHANNQNRSLCVRTDNNLITFFTINQSCTRNLQSIWYAAYLFLLFSITSVKLKQIQFVVCFAFFSLLSFLSFLSSPLDYRILIVIHSCVLLF